MKCTNCGAHLLDTDAFCPECGAKVIRERRCPECGALLREGTKFCHKCGSLVANPNKPSQETLDIPVDTIARNILSETEAEIRADRRPEEAPRRESAAKAGKEHPPAKSKPKTASHQNAGAKAQAAHSPAKKNAAAGRKTHYREEDWEEENWDEEDDWDEEEGIDVITVMTAVVGVVILVIAVILGYQMYQRYMPKDYGQTAEETQDETGEEAAAENGQALEDGDGDAETFTVTIVHNVNVRDNPSTTGTNILKVAKEGETYTGTGRTDDGEWYEILLEDGSTGYIFHEYVTTE